MQASLFAPTFLFNEPGSECDSQANSTCEVKGQEWRNLTDVWCAAHQLSCIERSQWPRYSCFSASCPIPVPMEVLGCSIVASCTHFCSASTGLGSCYLGITRMTCRDAKRTTALFLHRSWLSTLLSSELTQRQKDALVLGDSFDANGLSTSNMTFTVETAQVRCCCCCCYASHFTC